LNLQRFFRRARAAAYLEKSAQNFFGHGE